jgi:hypothetical protein
MLAAAGWDRALAQPPIRIRRILLVVGLGSVIAAAATGVAAPFVTLGAGAVDSAFGPFDSAGAWFDVVSSLAHTALVSLAAVWLLGSASGGREQTSPGREQASGGREPPEESRWTSIVPPTLLLLCAAELAFANYWLVPTAPARLWRESSPIAEVASRSRAFRAGRWWPAEFATRGSPERMEEIVAWERQTLAGRYALLDGVAMVNSGPRALAVAEYERLLDAVDPKSSGDLQADVLRRLGVELLILPEYRQLDFASPVPGADLPPGAALWRLSRLRETSPVEHAFDPQSFRLGAIISGASWIGLIVVAVAIAGVQASAAIKSSNSAPA